MPALGGPAEVVTYRPIGSSFRHPCLGTGRPCRDFLNELPTRDTSIRAQTWLKEGAMPDKGKSKSGGSVKKKKGAKKK